MKMAHKSLPITLADLAKKLKVSKVTISKALRDHPDISRETKKRVKTLATELGYTPNYIARNLSARKSGTIGVVVPKIAHHFFATTIETIYDTALEHNYEVILMVSQENARREALHIQTLLSMRVDGLLISVSQETEDLTIFTAVEKSGVPTVLFDRILEGFNFSTVSSDDEGGAFQIVEHAIRTGYTRIAHLAGYAHTSIGRLRARGYQRAMEKYQLQVKPEWIIEGGFSEKHGYQGCIQLVKGGEVPKMIFAVTYPVALGVFSAARAEGIVIPEQLDLICFGGSSYNQYVSPSITCVEQPVELIGKRAMELLLEEISLPGSQPVQRLVYPVELYAGNTCQKKIAS
jgi:LacI family transcriptional regulator